MNFPGTRKWRDNRRQALIHFAKQVIAATDSVIDRTPWFGSVDTDQVRAEAREMFNLELSNRQATYALTQRLRERGFLVDETTVKEL